jgi:hypothetical protein
VESIAEVSEALQQSILRLPRRSPREIKRFVNLWRFYVAMEYRSGNLPADAADVVSHARQVGEFVQLVLRWPHYLDRLGRHHLGQRVLISLAEAAGDPDRWQDVAQQAGLDPTIEAVASLREHLGRQEQAGSLAEISDRYL